LNNSDELDRCRNFAEIFELVKKGVKRSLGRRRVGLMLYLADLPLNVGAYHALGTNGIVLNRAMLDIIAKNARTLREINSYVYSILLHEYLHSLGLLDERVIKKLAIKVAIENFGKDHEVAQMALEGPLRLFPELTIRPIPVEQEQPEIILDFERPASNYIG
jgi:predicted Zn-dependent protease with MMP-like domain